MTLPKQDEQLCRWLAILNKHLDPYQNSGCTKTRLGLKVHVDDYYVQIWCINLGIALEVAQVAEAFQNDKYGLRIWWEQEELLHILPPHIQRLGADKLMINDATVKTSRSTWLRTNKSLATYWQQHRSMSIHSRDRDTGFPCLEVIPLMGVEAVLCKPIAQLVGQPANSATGIIGVTKERVIQEAISLGDTAIGHYEMTWNNVLWKKKISAILLDGTQEIMIITEGEAWHKDYWRTFAAK